MGRGKQHGGRQVVPINVAHTQVPHEERTCPLCIELLDATEKQFFPCPCGYQVCLFCFERIKRDCSNLCPGCRTEYGSEKDPFQKGELRQGGASTSSNSGATPQKAMAAISQQASPMSSPSGCQTVTSQRAGAHNHSDEHSTSTVTHAPESSRVPVHARNSQGQPAAVNAQGNVSWARSGPAVAERDEVPGQPFSRRQSGDATGPLGQSSLSNDAVRSAGTSEQGPAPRFQWPAASETLQSAAMRVGWGSWRLQKRRPEAPTSDPEGAALTSATQQAVREGRVSSSQGAAQLISFLQRAETHQGVATAQASYQADHNDNIDRPLAARSWSYSQSESPSAMPAPQPWSATERRHDNGGETPGGRTGWALNGGAQVSEHPDGLSRFSSLFAAQLEHTSGSGGQAFRTYQNGF